MQALVLEAELRPGFSPRTAANQRLSKPRLSIKHIPEPQVAADDDIIIKVSLTGICGSDTHVSEPGPNGFVKFSGPANTPVVLGHEFVGEIVGMGNGVSPRFQIGNLVAVESIQACRSCKPCHDGHFNQCQNVELIGLTVDGALARYVRVKEIHCHLINPILERYSRPRALEFAALLEPLGCAFCGLFIDREGGKQTRMKPGTVAAVFGLGPIGLGAVALLRAAGAEQILGFDLKPERIQLATTLGATAAYNLSEFSGSDARLAELINEHSRGDGLGVAVEAAGAAGLFPRIVKALGARARLIYLGRTNGDITFDPNIVVSNGITITGSRGHAGYGIFESLIEMIAIGTLKLDGMVTAHFDFMDSLAAFDRARGQRDGKILIHLEK